MRLRPYSGADWPEVLALWIAAWTQARADIDFASRAEWLQNLCARSLEQGAALVVAEDERIADSLLGFVLFDARTGWLEQIAVHPRAQGRGVARALIGEAKTACPGGLALSVNVDNAGALAFYAREGFCRDDDGAGVNPLSGLPIQRLRWTPRRPEA